MKPAILAVFFLTAVSCVSAARPVPQRAGLSTGAPGRNVYPTQEPGTSTVIPRVYKTAPPVVPHSTADQYITRKLNDCVECHHDGEEVETDHIATKIPKTHYQNEYTAERIEKAAHVVGMRNNCLQCHVPQAEGEPVPVAVRP